MMEKSDLEDLSPYEYDEFVKTLALGGVPQKSACMTRSETAWTCSRTKEHDGPHVATTGYASDTDFICLWHTVPTFASVEEAEAWLNELSTDSQN